MAVDMPPTVKADGNKVVVFLSTPPAASTGIPTLAEVNAALFGQCHIYGSFDVTPDQATGQGPKKLCRSVVPTQFGNTTYPAVEVEYSYLPQSLGTPGSDGNELYEALVPGTTLTAAVFDGIDGDTDALTAGDICDIFEVECGKRRKGKTGDGEFDEVSVKQFLIVVGGVPIAEDHALASA